MVPRVGKREIYPESSSCQILESKLCKFLILKRRILSHRGVRALANILQLKKKKKSRSLDKEVGILTPIPLSVDLASQEREGNHEICNIIESNSVLPWICDLNFPKESLSGDY